MGKVVLADYVTTDAGTGLVHTAPGHGEDDYETGLREKLDVYSPVLANGKYDDTVPEWLRGKSVWEANKVIPPRLKQLGVLFAEERITHSYPHDWRSKTPIIFRATEQWFVAMDWPFEPTRAGPGANGPLAPGSAGVSLRDRAMDAVMTDVEFVPKWGQARMTGMLSGRPDWCISRQRAWGLPIPVFYNDRGDPLLTPASVRAVAKRVAEVGSDCWFTEEPAALLGADFAYPDGFTADGLRKERDIFDVWFESGSSWHAVLSRPGLRFPADLYLEGSDQHRGWFQLSMLPALATTGRPPFRQVLTHGFIVKPDGTKVSKSDKEYVTATQEINTHGADLLRLWCCSVDYQNDIPTSPKVIKEFGDKYRKIRNTVRYLLSNLYDYDGQAIDVPTDSLDGWAMDQFDTLVADATAAYATYQTHRAFRLLHDFCSVQISAVYGNAMKDRLYCDPAASPLRRRSQTVMHRIVLGLTKLLSPMVVFTADEAWGYIPHKAAADAELPSVHLARLPDGSGQVATEQTRADWVTLMSLRDAALGQFGRAEEVGWAEQGFRSRGHLCASGRPAGTAGPVRRRPGRRGRVRPPRGRAGRDGRAGGGRPGDAGGVRPLLEAAAGRDRRPLRAVRGGRGQVRTGRRLTPGLRPTARPRGRSGPAWPCGPGRRRSSSCNRPRCRRSRRPRQRRAIGPWHRPSLG